jgi:integrase
MRAGATRGIERQFEQLNGLDLLGLPPGRHADGHGLYLEVGPSGSRTWVLEMQVEGRGRRLDLGPLTASPLGLARRDAAAVRARANRGEPLRVPARTLRGKRREVSLAYTAVPGLVRELRRKGASLEARLAAEFLILTAARTVEVLEARWDAIDTGEAVWTVRPGNGRRVPLSSGALELLGLARRFRSSNLVFPSPKRADRPLSNMAILMLLRRMGHDPARPLGFRRAFRSWAEDRTPGDVHAIARALGYRPRGNPAAASANDRRLLEDWGAFVTRGDE